MLPKVLWLALAGACGTVSRYSLCEAATRIKGCPSHVGTFAVNIIGSFLFGLIYCLAQRKIVISHDMRVILLTGFMGAFTTFSTFAFDTAKMMRASQWTLAAGNILAQIAIGIVAMVIGVKLGRSF